MDVLRLETMKRIAVMGMLPLALFAADEQIARTLKLENEKVKISEVTYAPGVARPRYTRPSDQIIVFLDDCRYQRVDSKTGEKTTVERKSGETIWHNEGEDAPVLTNLGSKAYRTLVIEMKK